MENFDKNQPDIKKSVPTSKQCYMHGLEDQNTCSRWPSTSHGSNDQTTSTSGCNEIVLRLDQCDANENEISGLFKYLEKYLPGYRFVPTDDQLIRHYLCKKLAKEPLPRCLVRDVDLYLYHPKDLAANHPKHDSLADEWYFFTPRDRKYPNGSRPKRAAGNGYWKATGADRAVKFNDEIVGFRQALVFYEGKPPKGEKTNWIMHEFKALAKRQKNSKGDMRLDDWVLCRIYYKKVDKPPKKEEVLSTSNAKVNHVEEAPESSGNNCAAIDNNGIPSMINYDNYDYEDILLPNSQPYLGESTLLDPNFLPNFSSSEDYLPFGSLNEKLLDPMVSKGSNGIWGYPNFDCGRVDSYMNFDNVHDF